MLLYVGIREKVPFIHVPPTTPFFFDKNIWSRKKNSKTSTTHFQNILLKKQQCVCATKNDNCCKRNQRRAEAAILPHGNFRLTSSTEGFQAWIFDFVVVWGHGAFQGKKQVGYNMNDILQWYNMRKKADFCFIILHIWYIHAYTHLCMLIPDMISNSMFYQLGDMFCIDEYVTKWRWMKFHMFCILPRPDLGR